MSGRRIGNYHIIDYIGSGGFGSVFKAEDVTAPGRVVAIKELHKRHTRNNVIKQRFFQEAVAMARLDHPNLPRLYTFGEDNGSYYLVMEFLSGKLLSDEIQKDGRVPAGSAIAVMTQTLEALSYAHRNGIIHRDLKPDNIMLLEGGELRIKVLDFGIARMVGGENLTLAGEGFGTPAYMSPERMTGTIGDDPRVDIYSAGIILFEMLTGCVPFNSTATDPVAYWSQMLERHENDPLPDLAPLGVPVELQRVVSCATAKNIGDRYQTADDMIADLKRINTGALVESAGAAAGAARLFLTTAPAGAEVYVDDELRGTSDPVRGKITIGGLAPGLHSVRVLKSGYNEYRISVALEEGRQTDLQVALAAGATVVVPPAEKTSPGGFETVRIDQSESRTALFVVESLPAGATVLVGDTPVARAGEDGRATVKLEPGSHEIEVKAPSGETTRRLVTVAMSDTGPAKAINITADQSAASKQTTAMDEPSASATKQSSGGKRAAAAAAVVLLLAIAAAAFFVMRGKNQPDAATGQAAQQATVAPPNAPAAAGQQPDEKSAEEAKRAQAEAARANAAKQQAEKDSTAPPPAAAPTPPVPAAPQTNPASPPNVTPQEACVTVSLSAPVNFSAVRFKVMAVEQPDTAAPIVYNGITNDSGAWRRCGLKAGNRLRIVVAGMRGVVRASREIVLAPGVNTVEFQAGDASTGPRDGGSPVPPRMRRPRMQRP